MTDEQTLEIAQKINLGVDMENFSSQSAMILINGKPEPGTTEFPQSGFYINEEQTLDDSFTEQISQVYKHLNNLIIVANQHGTIINQIVKREKEQAKPNDLLDGLINCGQMSEFKNNDFLGLMNSAMENKPNELTTSRIDNSLKGLKSTLQGLCYASENIFEQNTLMKEKMGQIDKRITQIGDQKSDKSDEMDARIAIKKELRDEFGATADRLDEKMTTIEKEVESRMNGTMEKLGEIQKETLWKIKDCERMLKARPTEKYISTSVEQIHDTTDKKLKDMEEKLKDAMDDLKIQSHDMFTSTDKNIILQLKTKITEMENKLSYNEMESASKIKKFFSEKFGNYYMKFEDMETMIQANQKRIEELAMLIKNLETTTIKFSSFEESTNSKFDMLNSMLGSIREDLVHMKFSAATERSSEAAHNNSNGGTNNGDDRGSGGGGSSIIIPATSPPKADPSSGLIIPPKPVMTKASKLEQEMQLMTSGQGLGMTQQEKNNLRRCQDDIESINRRLKEIEERIKHLEEKMGKVNEVISIIQTDIGYKLDKEQFDQALEFKLDKDEFYAKINENSLDEDNLKKLEHNLNKATKKLDKLAEELKSKVKKVKKKSEKTETKLDSIHFDLEELKVKFGNGDLQFKNNQEELRTENGKTLKEEVEGLNRAMKRLFHIVKTLRNEHIKAIGTTRAMLCLSCGAKDVNFPPPGKWVKAADGHYYQTDNYVSAPKIQGGNEYDYGKDVFTKEQIVKEEVLKRHIPVDMILGMDVDDMHMGSILPRNGHTHHRPKTMYSKRKRAGSANPHKTPGKKGNGGVFRKSMKQTTLQPLRLKNKTYAKTSLKETKEELKKSIQFPGK